MSHSVSMILLHLLIATVVTSYPVKENVFDNYEVVEGPKEFWRPLDRGNNGLFVPVSNEKSEFLVYGKLYILRRKRQYGKQDPDSNLVSDKPWTHIGYRNQYFYHPPAPDSGSLPVTTNELTTIGSQFLSSNPNGNIDWLRSQDFSRTTPKISQSSLAFPDYTSGEEIPGDKLPEIDFHSLFVVPNRKNFTGCPPGQRKNHNGDCVKPYIHNNVPGNPRGTQPSRRPWSVSIAFPSSSTRSPLMSSSEQNSEPEQAETKDTFVSQRTQEIRGTDSSGSPQSGATTGTTTETPLAALTDRLKKALQELDKVSLQLRYRN